MKPIKGARNLRKGRFSEQGQVYHCIFSTLHNEKIFRDFELARLMINIIKNDELNGFTTTYAFTIMPDHIHWLFEVSDGNLSLAIKRVKSLFSWISKKKIWNSGFYDHAIRADEDLISTARYIVANPLRAGLVDKVGDYPHWDCIWLDMN